MALFEAPTPKDWPEDWNNENGNYQCVCGDCKQTFIGHKRRIQCKECATLIASDFEGRFGSWDGKVFTKSKNTPVATPLGQGITLKGYDPLPKVPSLPEMASWVELASDQWAKHFKNLDRDIYTAQFILEELTKWQSKQ